MRPKSIIILLILWVATGVADQAVALDGERKGFLIGIGVGPGLTSFNQSFGGGPTSSRSNELSVMTDFRIGYAPTNFVQLYWTSKVSWFGMSSGFGDDVIIANGFGGLAATYSFYEEAPSPFLSGGLGLSTWGAPFEENAETLTGLGIMVGGGFEFSKHWSVELNLMWGEPSENDAFALRTNALSVKLTINVLAY